MTSPRKLVQGPPQFRAEHPCDSYAATWVPTHAMTGYASSHSEREHARTPSEVPSQCWMRKSVGRMNNSQKSSLTELLVQTNLPVNLGHQK